MEMYFCDFCGNQLMSENVYWSDFYNSICLCEYCYNDLYDVNDMLQQSRLWEFEF